MNNINAIQVKIGGKRRPPAPLPPLPPLPRRLLHTVRRAACRAFEPLPTPPSAHGPSAAVRSYLRAGGCRAGPPSAWGRRWVRREPSSGRGAAGARLKESDGDCSEAEELCGTV